VTSMQVSYSCDNEKWSMIRLAYFTPQVAVKIGMMAAAPGKQPREVTFEHFAVGSLLAPPLED
jgi:regulation of enolase protein 1 (concanavalin A-like superfamily)